MVRNRMSRVSDIAFPNEFEELVMVALIKLRNRGYGVSVRREMERRLGHTVSVAGVYTVLERLEEQGLVTSWVADPTPERGGRAKKFFRLEAAGAKLLLEKRKVRERMWNGVPAQLRRLLLFPLVLVPLACTKSGEHIGEREPSQPEVFAPETISVGNVYRGTFAPDGKTFLFFKKVTEGEEDFRIFQSTNTTGRWTTPEQVSLGGEYSDLYPTISPDGDRLIFSSYRPAPGDTSSYGNANLWYADRLDDGWGKPVFMATASTFANYDAKPFFGPDGSVYFESTSPDWRITRSLVTRWDGTAYRDPEVFEAVERWRGWRSDLYVWGGVPGPDGTFIILDISERDIETGHALSSDQWISFRERDGGWTEPTPLGTGLNSVGYDTFTFFSHDERQLFFVRDFDRFFHISLAVAVESVR